MLLLKVKSPLSFQWNGQPPQWRLCGGDGEQKTAQLREFPFVIGRADNCQLVLPDSNELRKTTSRWHCYIEEEGGKYFLVDGSCAAVPETGEKKPSASGTFINGTRISGRYELTSGDKITIGPWELTLEEEKRRLLDIDTVLQGAKGGRRTTLDHRKSQAGYQHLHELLSKLNTLESVEEALTHLLTFAAGKIPAARALAILLHDAGGANSVRVAWSSAGGRIFDFAYSPNLLEHLKVNEPVLLEPKLPPLPAGQKPEITSALLAPLSGGSARLGALYMDNRGYDHAFTQEDLHLAATIGSLVSLQLMSERQVRLGRLEENFRQYFSSNVVRRLVREADAGHAPALAAAERAAAILFVDIAGFSAFCHNHSPGEVSGLLNPYFKLMSECIHRHGGYVDKFIGDAVMGVFEEGGTLVAEVGNVGCVVRAARAAKEMIQLWRRCCKEIPAEQMPLRIGIDAGRVVIGNVGFPGRMEYTAIGDAVNLASRLQKLATPDGMALTDQTAAFLRDQFPVQDAGGQEIKGFGRVNVSVISFQ